MQALEDKEVKIVSKKIYELIKELEQIKEQENIIQKQLELFRQNNIKINSITIQKTIQNYKIFIYAYFSI